MKYLVSLIRENYGQKVRPITGKYMDQEGNPRFPTNISIIEHKGRLIANTRLTDYAYIPVSAPDVIQYTTINKDFTKLTSTNIIQILNSTEEPKVYNCIGPESIVMNNGVSYKGLEDIRLINWDGVLYGIGFRPDVIAGKVIPQFIQYNDNLTINRSWFLNTNKGMEKNWQPIENRPFTFMYDPAESKTITLDIENLHVADNNDAPTIINDIETPEYTAGISGSSQLIQLNDGTWLSICHKGYRWRGADGLMHWVYNHHFVCYDGNMNKYYESEPFRFIGDCMEFCCGMCREGDNVHITFSILDGSTHIISITYEEFLAIVNSIPKGGETPAYDYIKEMYTIGQIKSLDRIPCVFLLESLHDLDSLEEIPEIIEEAGDMASFLHLKSGMFLHFIIRRQDNESLLKYYINTYDSI